MMSFTIGRSSWIHFCRDGRVSFIKNWADLLDLSDVFIFFMASLLRSYTVLSCSFTDRPWLKEMVM